MKGEHISWNGRVMTPGELEIPLAELLTAHYIYQRVHVSEGKILQLDRHMALTARAFWNIHRTDPAFDTAAISKHAAALLAHNRYQPGTDAVLLLYFFPCNENADLLITCERPLINKVYAVSSLRPTAISYPYDIPYEGFPTNFQLSAARLYDTLALQHGATRSIRRNGDKLVACGDSPLFGIRGKTLFTAPLLDGAVDSVERHLTIDAARTADLDFLEEPVPHSELKDFDELFYADASGIVPLGQCDDAHFMSLLVNRLILMKDEK